MLHTFEHRLEKLNENQRKAVDTIEGPVMVIAGPGAGKTETLGARIANILASQSDISSGNILCLTYTNAGVVAMRKRLVQFIGPDAHKVQIHTFHSFCNMIIQENAEYFGIKSAENISELDQVEAMEGILDSLAPSHEFFHKSSYASAKKLLDLFGLMKSENWDEKKIENDVQDYLNDLPKRESFQYKRKYTNKSTGEVFQKGDVNPKKIADETQRKNRLVSAALLFPEYQKYLQENGYYDFNDMILWILDAFKNDENFLSTYQEQFQYILVDEFQDTNGSQKKLIDYLCQYWDAPNIFVVGDDDQSIYRFQGANMRNVLEFYSHHSSDIEIITLDKNYRSSQKILDLADHIIEKNSERLVSEIPNASKKLSAQNPSVANLPITPSLREYYNSLHEDLGVLKRIKALQEKGEDLSHIAVIYQNHSQVENLLRLCEDEKIPVRVKQTQNILDLALFQQVFSLMNYFHTEQENPFSGEKILFQSLFYPFFGMDSSEISAIALQRRNTKKEDERYLKILLSSDEFLNEKVKNLLELEKDFASLPLLRFTENLLQKTGILEWVMKQNEKGFLLRILSTFFDFLKSESAKNPNISFSEIQEKIRRMNDHGIALPIQKTLYEKSGVNFITAHSSKGLEFDYVFVIGVDKKVWDSPQRENFSFPDTLTRSNSGDFLEEKRRLFFVALTRAAKFLEVSYSQKNLEGKELDSSIFISEMAEKIAPESVEYSEEEILLLQKKILFVPEENSGSLLSEKFILPLLEDYILSPTHLNKYLACPLAFYYENLLRIPSSMTPAAAFGNAMHRTLEKTFLNAKKDGNFSEGNLLHLFESAIGAYRFVFTDSEYKKFLSYGKEILPKYFSAFLEGQTPENFEIEKSFRTHIGNVPVSGKMDRVDILENGGVKKLSIVDYKTGNPSSPFTKKKCEKPNEKNENLGGDYWRQIVFYSLLAENIPADPSVMETGVLDFLEPDSSGEFCKKVFRVTEEEKKIVQGQIEDVYEKIQNMEFFGCTDENCEWCKCNI